MASSLNSLGLSTQCPAHAIYVSSGPTRFYRIGNTEIVFKHTTPKDICGLSKTSIAVVIALKALGKDRVDGRVKAKLRSVLDEGNKQRLLRETSTVTVWVREAIADICEDIRSKNNPR